MKPSLRRECKLSGSTAPKIEARLRMMRQRDARLRAGKCRTLPLVGVFASEEAT